VRGLKRPSGAPHLHSYLRKEAVMFKFAFGVIVGIAIAPFVPPRAYEKVLEFVRTV